MSRNKRKVIIIGGGITGLSTAYFLQEKAREADSPVDITLIEGEKRLGGKILTERVDDFIIEGGPDSFITQKPGALDLCRRLGMTDHLVRTCTVEKSVYILSGGKLMPLPEGFNLMVPGRLTPFLFSPLVSPYGKVRMGFDLLIPRKDSPEDESIASFVRRRLGEEALQKFAEPILAGIFAGDAEKLSLTATFPQFASLEKSSGSLIWGMWMRRWDTAKQGGAKPEWTLFVTLREGLSSLVEAVRGKLEGVRLISGEKVCAVIPQKEGYAVSLENETYTADVVVVTTKTGTAAGWIEGWDPSLSGFLREIKYVSTATVSLGFRREDVPHPLNGFGFVVPRRERRKIIATTWSSTKFPGRAPAGHVLIRAFIGGAHHEDLIDRDDAGLIALVRKELESILGIQAEPVVAKAFRWIKANPQYNLGHLDRVARIEKETQKHPGFFLAGAAYRGVGIPDCIRQGMETAEKIVQYGSAL
ncbi:MAG: protoporphyrinogen oxidase [Nitrospira sp.]|nr:protoporphyrinogen oxidase [Candidatus Manganitrophaceae bacterium]HIL33931.1 protoporphyrinogen oxidase [Candidatus Manganitrophaceae bacterium]